MSSILINAINENNGELSFTLSGVDTSVANAIRRTIMSDIQTIVFRTFGEENNVAFTANTCRLNNEILSQRLGCIPIHVLPNDDEYTANDGLNDLLVVVNEENTTDVVQTITTKDFKIKRISTDEFLSEEKCRDFFKPFIAPNGKEYFIEFCRLRPRISDEIPGEKLAFTCPFSYGMASENNMYNIVGTCAYGCTVDDARAEGVLERQKQEWQKAGLMVEREATNWELLEKKRIIVPNSFDFIIGTLGPIPNGLIMVVACGRLKRRFEEMIQTIDNDSMKSEMINDLSIDYILENNDYTVGCVLNHLLFTNYFTKEKTLQYCGFKKIHPHDTHSIIRMMFKDKDETESSASSSRASLKASMKKEEELVEETADYSPGYAESASSEPKESDANYSPPYSTTQAADYSPPYSTTEPANKPVPFSTVKKANDNYSPPYSTTEPGNQGNQMRGGNPVMYQRMGFGYIKQCCLEAIQVFDTILKTFDK
jgi:DNA-directed RNA polymerase subunit L